VTGHDYEGLYQAVIGGVVAGAIFMLIKHELGEYRSRKIKRARQKFRN